MELAYAERASTLLDPRLEAFAQALAYGSTQQEALAHAGFSHNTRSHEIVSRPHVAARIRELISRRFEAADITAERVLVELGRIAFASYHDIVNKDGTLKSPAELSEAAAATIVAVDYEEASERRGRVIKLRRASKDAALALLAKHFKLVGDADEAVTQLANTLADRLAGAKQRSTAPAVDVPHRDVIDSTHQDEELW